MSYLLDYSKAIKVVESVKTIPHYYAAKKYINFFITKWGIEQPKTIFKKESIKLYTSHTISSMYSELKLRLKIKEQAIS